LTSAANAEFDLGPLTWVKAEIDQSLAKGVAALQAFAQDPDEQTQLRHAQTHIHQAAGAVQIVGLDGAITLLEEIERHLALLETLPAASIPAHTEAIGAACRRLTRYLNELTDGEPPVTLKLYPEYETLARLRGSESASPTDLFYPDLTRRPPRPERVEGTVGPGQLPAFMRTQRRTYQQGLLNWLRGDGEGLAAMQSAVRAIEQGLAGTATGAFWWSVSGFLSSTASEGILPSYTVKQLCARIDLQIRRFVEGSTKVADRLRREVLYHVAISEPVTDRVREVQELYDLPAMLPKKIEARQVDIDRYEPLLKHAHELIGGIKDNWLKVTGGRRELLAAIAQSLGELKSLVSGLHEPALTELVGSLENVAIGATKAGSIPEVLAMEFATGLLLTEDAIGHFARLSDQFPKQVEAMRRRLDYAQRGVLSLPTAEEDLLDETARRAQERMLLSQVAREIQGNLRHVEKVLDGFFRDPGSRGELAGLATYTRQIQGALQMLGLAEANELLQLCQNQIDTYAQGAAVSNEELEVLAESLSGLGFYIEAVEQQRPDAARLLDPFMRQRLGLEDAPAVAEADAPVQSIESAIDATREDLPEVLDRFRAAPRDPALHAELNNILQALKQDADLVADTQFSNAATRAIGALDNARMPVAELLSILEDLAPKPVTAAPAPSAETIRLLDAGEEKLDAELSEIFLAEAHEVLESVARNRTVCESNPNDREALRAIRRGFHTLKGSGRMVGLNELGETAYTVEKVLNRWLEEERSAVPELLAVVSEAETGFGGWIAELQQHGSVHVDDSALSQAIAALEAAHPGRAEPHVAPVLEALSEPDVAASTEVESIDLSAPAEPEQPAATPPAAPAHLVVGDTVISTSLYQILLEETAQLLDTLRREHNVLEFEPRARPSEAMVRAAHTLTGIHRTAGFTPVADLAQTLETTLLTLQHQSIRHDSMLPALADAAQSLAELVDFIGMRQSFSPMALHHADQSHARLRTLQETTGGFAVDSETLAAQAALADELPADAVADTRTPAIIEPDTLASIDGQRVIEIESAEPEPGAPAPVSDVAPPEPAQLAPSVSTPSSAPPSPELPPHVAEPIAEARQVAVPSEPAPAAVAQTLATVGEALASVRDDLDSQLLPIFLEEAQELFPRAGSLLRDWRKAPGDASHSRELRRTLHTLKGSARMAGAMRLGELTHLMESRLLVRDREVVPSTDLFDALDSDLDHVAALIDQLQSGTSATPAEAQPELQGDTVVSMVPSLPEPAVKATVGADEPAAEGEVRERATVRVRTDVIDRLVNETGEVSIARARIEGELRSLKSNLLELTNSVIRLRGQVREIEIQAETQIQSRMSQVQEQEEGFDPLEFDRYTRFQELSRSLAEGVNDVATVQQALLKNLDDADAALMVQARLSRDVQQQLLAVRTVPFSSMSERLYRLLRQTAKELDKKANLEIRGGQTELDRGVLEKLIAPLEHLLRNALDHGIEDRAARLAAGKTEIGEVVISVRQEGNEIALTLTDDGRGLPLDAIRAKAVAAGMIDAGATPTQSQLVDAIFSPGFTTAQEVTQISGRGIGMDVVKNAITSLGGRVDVTTTAGRGTTFTLYLPLTLAVTQAVLVRAAGRIYALPAVLVEQVQQIKVEGLDKIYAAREVRWQARRYPFFYLPQLLGDERRASEFQRYNPVLLLKSANQFVAIHVDEMLGNQEIVIKNIGVQLARLPGLAGATVLGTGEIVLILNPVQLATRFLHEDRPATGTTEAGLRVVGEDGTRTPVHAAAAPARTPYVLVVDDSLTVRKITSRLLVREGFEAGTARDGVDALQILADRTPDVILLDIEMPRMDGFEFAKTVKSDPKLKGIPIIMITSRTAEKHRSRAREIGVEVYLGKPYQEEELLAEIRKAVAGQLTPSPEIAEVHSGAAARA
jgi:chemosensory pili system protein ChpA (sensor histidine kinase/response regulator)